MGGPEAEGGDAAPRWSGEEATSLGVEGEGMARGRRVHVREGGADAKGSSCEALGLVRARIGDKVEGFFFFFSIGLCAPRSRGVCTGGFWTSILTSGGRFPWLIFPRHFPVCN